MSHLILEIFPASAQQAAQVRKAALESPQIGVRNVTLTKYDSLSVLDTTHAPPRSIMLNDVIVLMGTK
jgi:hypothetical protein